MNEIFFFRRYQPHADDNTIFSTRWVKDTGIASECNIKRNICREGLPAKNIDIFFDVFPANKPSRRSR